MMQTKEVLLLLTEGFADWEAAYAITGIRMSQQYAVKTIAAAPGPVESMGGLRTEIDYVLENYSNFDNLAMLILPGGFGWQEGRHDDIASFVKKVREQNVPVAAICGATIFLGKHGFLDGSKHTGDELELFEEEAGYGGTDNFVLAQVAVDGGFVTANETAAVDFAHAIFGLLKVQSDEDNDGWRDYFNNGMVQ